MNTQQLFDLITVLEASTLTSDQQAQLVALKARAEAVRAAEAELAGQKAAEFVQQVTGCAASAAATVTVRTAQGMIGFLNGFRK